MKKKVSTQRPPSKAKEVRPGKVLIPQNWVDEADIMLANIERIDAEDAAKTAPDRRIASAKSSAAPKPGRNEQPAKRPATCPPMRIAKGEDQEDVSRPDDERKDPGDGALGRRGGGAKAASLNKKRRSEIAKKAAKSRWDGQGIEGGIKRR